MLVGGKKGRRTAAETYALQERLRDVHTRRLELVHREALLAWSASCRAQNELALGKYKQALREMKLDDDQQVKLLASARSIFAGHGEGDPRYLEKMMGALTDVRKIWDANLTGKKVVPEEETRTDEEATLSNDERIALITEFIERAGTVEVGSSPDQGRGEVEG